MKKIFTSIVLSLNLLVVIAQTTFYTANFSGGISTWTLHDNTISNAGNWQYVHNPINAASIGALAFKSASYSNGYILFMSDGTTDDGKAEDADIVSPAINCSSYSYIHMEFDEWFVQRNASSGTIYVSTDNVNWSQAYTINSTEGTTTHKQIDLTPFAANQPTVYLKFNFYGDHDIFWAIDDIKLVSVPMLDVAVDTVSLNEFIPAGNTTITGRMRNAGGAILNSVDMTYSINGGGTTSQSFQNLNIPPFGTYDFAFPTPAPLDSFIKYTITISAFGPNGGNDGQPNNDSNTKDVYALSGVPTKNILLEEFTTAPCQFCPMGATVVENIADEYNVVIPVALHAGFGTDAMTTSDHSSINTAIGNGSAPALLIDRVYWEDAKDNAIGLVHNADYSYTSWEDNTVKRMVTRSPLSLRSSNTYNSGTRELVVDVGAVFYTKMSGLAYRLNCFIVEDSVSGSGSGYNQINYYNNHENIPYNPWYGKGNPMVGYKHRHVARYMCGGAWGSIGTIPASVNCGEEYSTQYTYTLPAGWNANRIKLVALVQDYRSSVKGRTIINALEYGLNESDSNHVAVISSIAESKNSLLGDINLFPNPAKNNVTIDYHLTKPASIGFEVYNLLGEKIQTIEKQNLSSGDYRTKINTAELGSGIYFVAVKDLNTTLKTLKFVVAK